MYTPMHRALGRGPSPVTYELLEACVAAQVPEEESLDWKQTLPDQTGKPDWKDEWVKDVAAMANTGGGCLVYGVAQSPGPGGEAHRLVDVGPVGDALESRLRQVAAARINPRVTRLQFIRVSSDDGQSNALVVRVPASAEAPHLLEAGKDGRFSAPYRYGATTEWMREGELEAAYRRRFRRTTDLEGLLERRLAWIERRAGGGAGATLLAAAAPVEPRAETELSDREIQARASTADDLAYEILGTSPAAGTEMGIDLSVIPGLRRAIVGSRESTGREEEQHFDGSLAAFRVLEAPHVPGASGFLLHVATDEVERAVVEFVAAVAASARAEGADGRYAITVGLSWYTIPRGAPMRLARPRRLHPGKESTPVGRHLDDVERSTRELHAAGDLNELRTVARTLALDLLRQGGVASTTLIPD